MRWTRFYTQENKNVFAPENFRSVTHENQQTYTVPRGWSDAAVDLLIEKIFYPEMLPANLSSVPDAMAFEVDFRAVLKRIAGSLTQRMTFADGAEAQVFHDELCYILLHQIATLELEAWQKLGLDWAYGLPISYAPPLREVSYTAETTDVARRLTLAAEQRALDNAHGKLNITLPVENPESLAFISWKRRGDITQAATTLGQSLLQNAANAIIDACDRDDPHGFDTAHNPYLRQAVENARGAGVPEAAIRMAISTAQQGYEDISFALPLDEKEPAGTIETTLSLPDSFIETALTDGARAWDTLTQAIWSSGEPAVSFRDSAESAAAARASATINLLAFAGGREVVNTEALQHTARVLTFALDAPISVTNLAALLMSKGLAYDSDAGRATAALTAAFVSGAAHDAAAEIGGAENSKQFLQSVKNKIALLSGTAFLQKGLVRRPLQLRPALCPDVFLMEAAQHIWDAAYQRGKETGFRHTALAVIESDPVAATLLGAQTTGLSPVSALLHGRNVNPLVPVALKALGYGAEESQALCRSITGNGTLRDAPHINHKTLQAKGFSQAGIDAVESALSSALHIRYVFNPWILGDDFCERALGFAADDMDDENFDMLTALGFSEEQIAAANAYCCGSSALNTVKPAHAAVLSCTIPPLAQIKMQAAIEPFLSAPLRHTVRLDYAATIEGVQKLIISAWEMGVKQLRLYRENGTLLHALAPAEKSEEFQAADAGKLSA